MSNRILVTNNTEEDVLIIGAQIRPAATQEYTSFAVATLSSDPAFAERVASGDFTISNGTEVLPAADAAIYLSSLSSGESLIGVKSSLGYISTSVTTATVTDTQIIDPVSSNTWILTLASDTSIQMKSVSVNMPVISVNLTLQQDQVGFHKVTFSSDTRVSWAENRSVQMPLNPNGTTTINLTSIDNGITWLAKEVYRKDTPADVVNEMFDADTTRRVITNTFEPIGLQLVSQANVASGLLSYRMLANSSTSTVAEVEVTVDGIVKHSAVTPSFYQDQLVTQDILIDSSWDIRLGSSVVILFRETSGAVNIEVKGDVQSSTLAITNIVEGEPVEVIGVASTSDVRVLTTPTVFGLTWNNDTADGFISATANLAFNVTSDASIPLDLSITVDGVQRYSVSSAPLLSTQRLEFTIPVDESWQVNADSTITVYGSISNGSITTMIMGSTARSELVFSDIVPGIPSSGSGGIEGTNTSRVTLESGVVTDVITISPPVTAITDGQMTYNVMLSSNFASSCLVEVKVDGVQKYSKQWNGISSALNYTETALVDASWGIAEGSTVVFTCKETSGNPGVSMIVNGDVSATTLSIK